ACVLMFAGGKPRFGVLGSALGVHRFVTTKPVGDPVAETQRIAGAVLGYMTKMGVSSSIVEAMSETREIRWLAPKEALAMNLITDPVGRPCQGEPDQSHDRAALADRSGPFTTAQKSHGKKLPHGAFLVPPAA